MEEYIRDYAMAVAIYGMFSVVWFGWAQENPPKAWRKYIGIVSGLGVIICAAGIYLSINNWETSSVLDEPGAMNYYLIFVLIEFLIGAIGSILLFRYKKGHLTAPWIAFIIGVHFFGLRYVFDDFSMHILGVLITALSLMSLKISKRLEVSNSAVTGIGAGGVLLAFSLFNLVRFWIS